MTQTSPEPNNPRMVSDGVLQPTEHWLFAGVDAAVLRAALESGREVRFLPGEALFHENDTADGLYLITAGSVRVSATAESGETLLAVVRSNEVLGEMGVLDGQARSGTATAVGVCVAFFMPTEPFLDLLERSTTVCMRLLALLATRLRRANGRLGELAATGTIQGTELPHEA